MAKKVKHLPKRSKDDIEQVIRSRGGYGRTAKWEWGLYWPGEVLPIVKGETTGARKKAVEAAHAAHFNLELPKRKNSK